MWFGGLFAVAALSCGAASDRVFTNVDLSLPNSLVSLASKVPSSNVSSREVAVFLALMSGQELKVPDLDQSGALVEEFFSAPLTDASPLPPRPRLIVVTTVNELDRHAVPLARTTLSDWRAPGEGDLDDIVKSVRHMGSDVTPRIVDSQLVREAVKAAELQREKSLAEEFYKPNAVPVVGQPAEQINAEPFHPPQDKCLTMLQEEKNAIAQIASALTSQLQADALAGLPLVISLNPSRVTDCLRHEEADVGSVEEVAKEVLQLVRGLETAASSAAQGDALIAEIFYEPRALQKAQSEASQFWPPPPVAQPPPFVAGFAVDDARVEAVEAVSAVQISARRLQDGDPTEFPIPTSIVLWLCVGMTVFVVAAVLPLWWLSDLDDPVIDTKLFAATSAY